MAKEFLDKTGLTYFWGKIKGFFVKGNTGYYFAGTSSTAAATVDKEVECSNFTASDLSPGATVSVIFTNTNSGAVGSLTLNVSGTGAKPIKYIANNAYGNLPSAGYLVANLIYTFIYDGTNWVVCNMNYNSNDPNYRNLNYYGLYKTYTSLYRYEILLTKSEGMLLPINTVDRGQSSATKVLTTESFDPFGEIFWYQTTSIISAGGNIAAAVLYRQYLVDMRYSFNVGISSANYLTARDSVFLVASPQSDGSAKLHTSPLSNSLPSSEDGLIYIYLGQVYDTYRIELSINHPIYWYKNNAVVAYSPYSESSKTVNGHTVAADVPSGAVFTDTTYSQANSKVTGISIADHGTASIYGVGSSTTSVTGVSGSVTGSHVKSGGNGTAPTLGTAFTVPNVTARGSGAFTQGSFSGGSFTQGTDSFTANTPTAINTSKFSGGSFTRGTFSGGSGSFTQGAFSGGSGSFSATVSNHVMTFSHSHTAATHGSDSHTHTAATHAADSFTAASLQSGFYTAGTAASFTQGTDSFTPATHGADSHTHTAPTLGTAFTIPNVTSAGSASNWVFEDVTVPKAATSATTVPVKNSSATTVVTGKTHSITDNGHTHTLS